MDLIANDQQREDGSSDTSHNWLGLEAADLGQLARSAQRVRDWMKQGSTNPAPTAHIACLATVTEQVVGERRQPYAWEVTQGDVTKFVTAAEFTRSSYDTGSFKPLYE